MRASQQSLLLAFFLLSGIATPDARADRPVLLPHQEQA